MFLKLCHFLNLIGLADVAAWLRLMAHRHLIQWLETTYHDYANSDRVAGFIGWGEMKYLGVLWFVSPTPVGTARDGSPLYNLYRW